MCPFSIDTTTYPILRRLNMESPVEAEPELGRLAESERSTRTTCCCLAAASRPTEADFVADGLPLVVIVAIGG